MSRKLLFVFLTTYAYFVRAGDLGNGCAMAADSVTLRVRKVYLVHMQVKVAQGSMLVSIEHTAISLAALMCAAAGKIPPDNLAGLSCIIVKPMSCSQGALSTFQLATGIPAGG